MPPPFPLPVVGPPIKSGTGEGRHCCRADQERPQARGGAPNKRRGGGSESTAGLPPVVVHLPLVRPAGPGPLRNDGARWNTAASFPLFPLTLATSFTSSSPVRCTLAVRAGGALRAMAHGMAAAPSPDGIGGTTIQPAQEMPCPECVPPQIYTHQLAPQKTKVSFNACRDDRS